MRLLAGLFLAPILALAPVLTLALAAPAAAQPVNTGHLTAELVAARESIRPGETIQVALRQKIQKGWHTYWRNSGDSGDATSIAWTLPEGWKAGPFVWPAPKRLPVGPLMNYGYEGEVLLPMTLTAPASAQPGQTVTLNAQAAFLVCAEICVPEDAALTLSLPVTAAQGTPDRDWGPKIAQTLAAAPKRAGLAATFEPGAQGVSLAITGAALKGADLAGAYFFPYSSTLLEHAKPQPIERGPQGLTLTLTPGYGLQEGRTTPVLDGVLTLADGRAFEVAAKPAPPPAEAKGLGEAPPARVTPKPEGLKAIFDTSAPEPAAPAAAGPGIGLLAALAFAFLGGLILNLMPCVFPVLAMKAAALAAHGGAGVREARREGLAFGAGVLVTFAILAAGLIALKAGGAAIGWGFQLQSPPVVAILALLVLAVALNLSGVFEVGTGLQGAGTGLAARGGLAGAFFTGALAVVVAAPCTAPFMGASIGWALTQSPPAAFAVFMALGLGFAAPFVAVACAPGLIRRLPKPGSWMDIFRKALAFPMFAAAGWLAWVLAQQSGPEGLARLLAGGVFLAFALWLWGLAQKGARGAIGLTLAAAIIIVLSVAGAAWPRPGEAPVAQAASAGSLQGEAYSPARLAELRAEGRAVFVNYTAAWCVSCQVNDKVALSSAAVHDALARTDTAYLKADWTNRNAEIAAELASHGRAGVPLYLVYGVRGGGPEILPSILTPGVVVRALDAAANPQ